MNEMHKEFDHFYIVTLKMLTYPLRWEEKIVADNMGQVLQWARDFRPDCEIVKVVEQW